MNGIKLKYDENVQERVWDCMSMLRSRCEPEVEFMLIDICYAQLIVMP